MFNIRNIFSNERKFISVIMKRRYFLIMTLICVYETRMPPAATKSKYGKNLYVLHFDPAPPPGACDVSEVGGIHRCTYGQSLVTLSWPKL